MRFFASAVILTSFAALSASGQSVVSIHSGVVHYVEGTVNIDGKPVEMKFGKFPELKPNEVLTTEEGRAELLLTPGSFLRLAEGSSVRMVSNRLSDTRIELLKGEALVESVDFTKDSAAAKVKGNVISVLYKDSTTVLEKAGLFQFTTEPGRLRVYEGEAAVQTAAAGQLTLKKGRQVSLDGVALVADKFDAKVGDELIRWSSRRSGYLATANVAAARTLSVDGSSWNSYSGGYTGGWAFNPSFGMYTFVPMGGIAFSPFGYNYFSPYTIGQYLPYYGGYYGGGYGYYGNQTGNYGGNSSIGGGPRSRIGSGSGTVSSVRTSVPTLASGDRGGFANANSPSSSIRSSAPVNIGGGSSSGASSSVRAGSVSSSGRGR